MTASSLRDFAERELTVRVLGEERILRPYGWAKPIMATHLPAGTRLLLPQALVPVWYRNFSLDAAPSLVQVADWDSYNVWLWKLPREQLGEEQLFVETESFIDAIVAGRIEDAS